MRVMLSCRPQSHLSSWGSLLTRRSWFSLWTLRDRNRADVSLKAADPNDSGERGRRRFIDTDQVSFGARGPVVSSDALRKDKQQTLIIH